MSGVLKFDMLTMIQKKSRFQKKRLFFMILYLIGELSQDG